MFRSGAWPRICLLGALFAAEAAHSVGQEVADIPFFDAPPGSAALGGGIRLGQSLYRAFDTDDQRQFDLIPLYLYNGKLLFFRGTSGGVHLLNRDSLELNLLGRYRFQKLDPDRNEFYEGLDERKQSVDAGVEMTVRSRWGEFRADWLSDALDRHGGQSAGLGYRYRIHGGNWTVSPFISWTWQDDALTDYYFGVSEDEATPDRPAYAPGESQWVSYGFNSSWRLSDRITFFGNVGFGGADSSVLNSPLVEESSGSAVFLGGTYIFGNVRAPESYVSEERRSEWSWRVNYGYQADGNIVGEIDQGDFSKSSYADTNIAGVTFGKLLTDGPRVDFTGRVAFFRHFEEERKPSSTSRRGPLSSWARPASLSPTSVSTERPHTTMVSLSLPLPGSV